MTTLTDQDLGLWDRVEELVDRAPSWEALRLHRLHLIAARVRSRRGEAIPTSISDEWRSRTMMALTARAVLKRVRNAYEGRLLLMKGPEVAWRYPDPTDRPFRDLDILVDNPHSAQRSLINAGCVEFGGQAPHHLPALFWPDVPVLIELHGRPKSPPWLPQVSAEMVFGHATPSHTPIDGLLAPDPGVHALLLAAHDWAHDPLRRLGDVIDIAATLQDSDRAKTTACAREWGWDRLWAMTVAVTDAVTMGGALPKWLSIWTRHLLTGRDRTVVEHQLTQLVAPAYSVPARQAPRRLARHVRDVVPPRTNETWGHRVRRSRQALFHALMEESVHELRTPAPR